MPDLTTLDSVKAWLTSHANTDDTLLESLISEASQSILAYLSRPYVLRKLYTERRSGHGGDMLMLRNYPVISVQSVSVGAQSVPAAAGLTDCGYSLEYVDEAPPGRPQTVILNGYKFCRGNGNIQIDYYAGYFVSAEDQTAAATVAVDAPYGPWAADGGVTYANSTALTLVTGTPSTGQYRLGQARGTYQFASGDAGQSILISYSYIPYTLFQNCTRLVGESYKYKERIGTVSKSLGGQETVSFSQVDLPNYIKLALAPFRRTVPV